MNYKETLFFVGKCLTISLDKKNRLEIEERLKTKAVNWDNVVKLSTSHYVFPAVYCNLKRAKLLDYVPHKLVEYMQHITDLNRERNQQIIQQAKEVSALLLKNNITPVFTKGVGNLLEDLYQDIAERMVYDIDFLVSKNTLPNAIEILKVAGYYILKEEVPHSHGRHFPRMVHKDKIGAIEVHREMIRAPYDKKFNYKNIEQNIIKNKEDCYTLSHNDQLTLNILAKEINDYGYLSYSVNLRTQYDTFLISKKIKDLEKIINTENPFFKILNKHLALNNYALNSGVFYLHNSVTALYLKKLVLSIENKKAIRINKFKKRAIALLLPISRGLNILLKATYKKDYLLFLWGKISNLQFYKERFFKKSNS
jgi:hypothetical protein